jgi:CheY-like chemotaxis protein
MLALEKCATILLADDDQNDLLLIQHAFHKSRLLNPLQIVRDGEETVQYLAGEGRFADREKYPWPFLLLLDLHMPKQNGFEVLRWLRGRSELSAVKVAVLTSSSDERDFARAMALGAHSYFLKPGSLDEFVHLMLRIQGHWLLLNSEEAIVSGSASGAALTSTAAGADAKAAGFVSRRS